MRIALLLSAMVLAFAPVPAFADPLEDALRAHDEGRYVEARALLLPLAEAGNVDAQNRLSHMNWYGEGAPSDYAAAELWSRKAAAQGSAIAHFDIGAHYYTGTGVEKDVEQAFEWQLKSAELGDPWGARNVSMFYQLGIGTTADPVKSVYWRNRALDMGDPVTEMLTAASYLSLGAFAKAEAERLLQSAATQHNAMAQFVLGEMLLEGGDGWQEDAEQAHLWLSLAAGSGCLEAPALIRQAEASMSADELESAAMLVDAWQEANPVPLGTVHPAEPTACHPAPTLKS